MSKSVKIYTIITEDQGQWTDSYSGNVFLTKSKKHAQQKLEKYCKNMGVEDWLDESDNLAYVVELEVDRKEFEGE